MDRLRSATSRWPASATTSWGNCRRRLASYDAALKLYVAYSDWMMRVQFPQAIMPAAGADPAPRPGARASAARAIGQFTETFMMGQGQVNQQRPCIQGGVVQHPLLFPVHVAEIVRCTCLAIRRRRELLGPICKYDPLTSDLVDVLAAPPGPAQPLVRCLDQRAIGLRVCRGGQYGPGQHGACSGPSWPAANSIIR